MRKQWLTWMLTDMDEVIHDIRESWTDKDWDDYYQALAEANEELDEEIIQDAIEMEADY